MNTILKVTAGGALALAAAAANAQIGAPSSGASDALLFAEVLNSAGVVVDSYVGDTGVSISSLAGGTYGGGFVLNTANYQQVLTDAAKTGNTLVWAVEGGQYTGAATAPNLKVASHSTWLTTTSSNDTTGITGLTTGNLIHWATLNADVGTINGNLAAGSPDVVAATTAAGGLWDLNTSSGVSGWYNNGPLTGQSVTSGVNLFAVTATGQTTSNLAAATTAYTLSITSSGLDIMSAVPLPPAVWLLGSGLLGLAGIARRKSQV